MYFAEPSDAFMIIDDVVVDGVKSKEVVPVASATCKVMSATCKVMSTTCKSQRSPLSLGLSIDHRYGARATTPTHQHTKPAIACHFH
jgi:hypothetical protein